MGSGPVAQVEDLDANAPCWSPGGRATATRWSAARPWRVLPMTIWRASTKATLATGDRRCARRDERRPQDSRPATLSISVEYCWEDSSSGKVDAVARVGIKDCVVDSRDHGAHLRGGAAVPGPKSVTTVVSSSVRYQAPGGLPLVPAFWRGRVEKEVDVQLLAAVNVGRVSAHGVVHVVAIPVDHDVVDRDVRAGRHRGGAVGPRIAGRDRGRRSGGCRRVLGRDSGSASSPPSSPPNARTPPATAKASTTTPAAISKPRRRVRGAAGSGAGAAGETGAGGTRAGGPEAEPPESGPPESVASTLLRFRSMRWATPPRSRSCQRARRRHRLRGRAARRRRPRRWAAPRATACLGWASTATGRPSSAPTSWATSGMRDEPPTSSTAPMSSAVDARRADAPGAGRRPSRASGGRIIGLELGAGEPHLGLQRRAAAPGSSPRCPTDSASLASTHSWRSRATAAGGGRVVGVERGERAAEAAVDVGEHGLVEVDAAEALDALGLAEDLEAVAGLAQHGGVERAAAEVVDGDDARRASTRSVAA